jgi:hypothetical protein
VIALESTIGDYADDFSRSFRTIYSQQYLYGQFPYVELYSQEAERQFLGQSEKLSNADYSAEAYLQVSRRFSSRIRDLFLPSSLELSVSKRFVKDEDLTDLYNTYSLTARSTALNLFGNFGAYSLFPFYRTDEYSTSLSLNADVDEATGVSAFRRLEMNLDHFLSFEGLREQQLTLENRFSLRQDREQTGSTLLWGDNVKLLYLWSRHPDSGLRLPLLPKNIGNQGYWSHQENLELELSGPGEGTSYHPFNLLISHESTAVLPEYGKISAELALGFDFEKAENTDTRTIERYWRIGLRGGISMQIEF